MPPHAGDTSRRARHATARVALSLALVAGLSACGGGFRAGAPSVQTSSATAGKLFTRRAPERMVAHGTDVTILGPSGYCVDTSASQHRAGSSLVLLGNCAAIARTRRAAQPAQLAVLSASVGEARPGPGLAEQTERLDGFFRSEVGRGLIAQSGNASDVEILETFFNDDTFFVRARESARGGETFGDERWRAVLLVNQRLVSLSVIETAKAEMTPQAGLSLVRDFAQAVRSANTGGGEPVTAAPVTVAPPPPAAPTAAPTLDVGIFRKLFG